MKNLTATLILIVGLLSMTAPAWAQSAGTAIISEGMGWVMQGISTVQSVISAKQSYEMQKQNMQQQQLQNQQAQLQQYRCPAGQTPALLTYPNGSRNIICTTAQP
jgi:TolA-binding protein